MLFYAPKEAEQLLGEKANGRMNIAKKVEQGSDNVRIFFFPK
jgi:hypothetical protein